MPARRQASIFQRPCQEEHRQHPRAPRPIANPRRSGKGGVIDVQMQVELISQQQEKGRRHAAKCLLQHLVKRSEDQCSAFVRCLESSAEYEDLLRLQSSAKSQPNPEASPEPESAQSFAEPCKLQCCQFGAG